MASPVTASGIWQGLGSSRAGAPTPQDLTRRGHLKLAERMDLTRSRHIPIMILRQQARKILEQFLDAEWPLAANDEKFRLIEDIIAESVGLSPLEDIFREERWREIMVLSPDCVIARQNEGWQMMKVKFRDAGQVRRLLGKIVETGEKITNSAPFSGGFDVRTQNGYRVIGLTPPEDAGVCPMVLFTREEPISIDTSTNSVMMSKLSGSIPTPANSVLMSKLSGAVSASSNKINNTSGTVNVPRNGSSVAMRANQTRPVPATPPAPPVKVENDPFAKLKQKVSERIIDACARSGVYNLSAIATEDLGAGINGHITEVAMAEKINIHPDIRARLVREIMAAMYGG